MSSTMDSIFKIGFGVDLMNLDGSVDGIKFTKAFDNASVYIASRYVDVFWKFKRFFNIGYEAQLKKDINIINDFLYNLIRAKKENMTNAKSNLEKKEDILSRFMAEMEHDPKNITYEYLRDIVLNFVIAGKDTTAGTLSWFIYLLCKHPSVQEEIFQEVKAAIQAGQDICINEFVEKITVESLDKMKYLHATLSETLRLYPSVPLNSKSCFSDDTLPDGFNVNRGDVVFYMPYPMGRMEILWGDDAENFQPERWLDDDGSVRNESSFKFTAFQGQYNYENLKKLFGDGIFAVDGEKWRHQRKLASYEFSARALRNYSTSVFKTNATKLAYIIFDKAKSDVAFDIQELFMISTMDSIFKIGFGVDLMNLDGSVDGIKFTKAFDNASVYILSRYVDVFWKFKRFFNIGYEAQLKKDINVINDFIYNLIQAKKEDMTSAKNNLEKKEDIISRFMAEMEHDPKNITYEYLRDIALNIVIAGKDTIAGTLSWFIYLLCKHPSVQEKIFQEVKESTQTGQDIRIGEFTEKITEEPLDKMKYLHAALSETLRLYPSVSMNVKSCFSDDTLPDGFNVNRGDVVFYMPYPMGRMKILWGDDAENFQPERWLDDDGSVRNESPFKFTAFQAGPRICLGKNFAYTQMKIFAAVLLRFFNFKLSCKSNDVHYKAMITLHIDQGLYVLAYLR